MKDYSYNIIVTAKGSHTRTFGPYEYNVVCGDGQTLADSSNIAESITVGSPPTYVYELPAHVTSNIQCPVEKY